MRVLTWNINGIRASKDPLDKLFEKLDCDVICLQETKITGEFLDEKIAILDGYNSYFSHSKVKSGYSGVATYVKDRYAPISAEEGLTGKLKVNQGIDDLIGHYGDTLEFLDDELLALDSEGRCVMTEHSFLDKEDREKRLVIINVYCPRADPERPERLLFKLNFYKLIQIRAEALLLSGKHVIIVGDVNTCHKPIDHCDPANDEDFMQDPGRQWMDGFLHNPQPPFNDGSSTYNTLPYINHNNINSREFKPQFVDLLRVFEPTTPNLYTNWRSSTGARTTNYGCRIDYIFADSAFSRLHCSSCCIRPDVMGSDHCPVVAKFECRVLSAYKYPSLCSKYMARFSGTQTKLSNYFMSGGEGCYLSSQESNSSSFPGSSNSSSMSNNNVQTGNVVFSNSQKNLGASLINSNKRASARGRRSNDKLNSKVTGLECKSISEYFKVRRVSNDINQQGEADSQLVMNGRMNETAHFENSSNTVIINSTDEPLYRSNKSTTDNQIITNDDFEILGSQAPNAMVSDIKENISNSRSKPIKLKTVWNDLLKGPPDSPLCKGHNEPCVLRTVKKDGPNKGKQFWVCGRPEGHKSNALARCDFFVWVHRK